MSLLGKPKVFNIALLLLFLYFETNFLAFCKTKPKAKILALLEWTTHKWAWTQRRSGLA